MFKNAKVFKIPMPWPYTSAAMAAALEPKQFQPCGQLDTESTGWIAPRDGGDFVHAVEGMFLIRLQTEKKILPQSVVVRLAKEKAAEIEENQGFKPGKKQMREIREQITDELLPKVLSQHSSIWAWIDTRAGLLVIDTASDSKVDLMLKLLITTFDKFTVDSLRTTQSPMFAMTEWLSADEALKRITPLDIVKESASAVANDAERFDAEFLLMATEIRKLIRAVVDALGGEMQVTEA